MKKHLLTIVLLILVTSGFAQKVKFVGYNNNFEKFRDSHHFDYLHEDFDTTKLTWVADLKVEFDTVIPGMIGESFKRLKAKANKSGANCFKVKDSDIYKYGRDKFITISVYFIRMEDRSANLTMHKSCDVYLFGFLGFHKQIEGYDVKIQDNELLIRALTYHQYNYAPKTGVSLQLGSKSRGSRIPFVTEEKMYPKFYYFTMVKGSYKNAWIDEYSLSFGLFLTNILNKE